MYSPPGIRDHYDRYGVKEWERLEKSLHGLVEYEVTLHVLRRHLPQGAHILDAGGGPGRYTIALAKEGHRVHLVDISEEQLKIARGKIDEAGVSDSVTAIDRLDVCDMSTIPDATYDAVICLGGALSYVRDRRHDAIRELIRVAKPGSPIVVSVMSLLGTFHLIATIDAKDFLENITDHVDWDPTEPFPEFLDSVPGSLEWHAPMTLYTSRYMRGFLEEHGCEVLEMASTNTITSGILKMEKISSSPEAIEMLLNLEKKFCNRPGVVDMGEHLIAVARTPRG
jgi:2-polyprenyl-3-methyl-5-hydroxy-6-metoxy-1,4-benzoquinol methylase